MEDPRKLLQQLELALLDPANRTDSTILNKLIADDFVEVGASGRTFGKDEVLARLPAEAGVSFLTEDMRVNLLSSSVGLVTYIGTRTSGGVSATSKGCSVWRNNDGQWQMVYHQGTAA
jgi:hypothetical protein